MISSAMAKILSVRQTPCCFDLYLLCSSEGSSEIVLCTNTVKVLHQGSHLTHAQQDLTHAQQDLTHAQQAHAHAIGCASLLKKLDAA